MTSRFQVALGLFAILCVAAVGVTIVQTDTVSDLLFRLPSWAVVAIIVAWPLVGLLIALFCGRSADHGDAMWADARRRRNEQRAAASLDLEVDVAGWDWPAMPSNVQRLPERESAQIIHFPTGGTRA